MSEDTFTELMAQTIAKNLRPLVVAGWSVVLGVIAGTVLVLNTVNDTKVGIADAKRDAGQALKDAETAIKATTDLRATVIGHDRDLAVLKFFSEGKKQ